MLLGVLWKRGGVNEISKVSERKVGEKSVNKKSGKGIQNFKISKVVRIEKENGCERNLKSHQTKCWNKKVGKTSTSKSF